MSALTGIKVWIQNQDLPEDFKQELLGKLEGVEKKKKNGLFPIPGVGRGCRHSEHNPPGLINIPQGQGYKHTCPKCGKKTIIIPPQNDELYGDQK